MSSIDIRNEDNEEVDEIVFADETDAESFDQASYIISSVDCGKSSILIKSMFSSINIFTKEDAQNLIKALNKAIELGWVK